MTTSTPLDTLKHTVLRANDMLDYLTDALTGSGHTPDVDELVELVEGTRRFLFDSLAEQVPEIRERTISILDMETLAKKLANTYEDGSPVQVVIDEGQRAWRIYPRLEPELMVAKARVLIFSPDFAKIVDPPDSDPLGGDAA